MKLKYGIFRGLALIVLVLVVLSLFPPTRLLMEPLMTPDEYLAVTPHVTLFGGSLVWIVPSSTVIVYGLGILVLFLAYSLFKDRSYMWGASFLFWGLGTLLAGTSYQGLGYQLKCAGQTYCLFTSWFELSYLFITAISMALMAVAFSQTTFKKEKQQPLIRLGMAELGVYTILLVLGSILQNRFLISYELFTIFFMPMFVLFFILNIRSYHKQKSALHKQFIILWILFLVVNVGYYVYYFLGVTEMVYAAWGL
ncbi:MAG: hypothetical protein NTV44_04260, partial [Firmicutes bacterium]|nr:hypothetical protein [Bacillota bacterium]